MAGIRRSYGRRWADAARHPARRDGAVLWALLVLPWAAALAWVHDRHHLDAGGWGLVLSVSLGLPTLFITWAAFRDARRSASGELGLDLTRVADELAAAVGRQWEREAAVRRLNDPYPLPVSWTAAGQDLAADWGSLVRLASTGAGWPAPVPGRSWAAGPAGLAGEGGELARVLAQVPTGRLAVLGEPGAGKTMLMVRLVLDLLADRSAGGPVPVLVPVASWDPSGQDLRGWLAARLITDYPALAAPGGAAGLDRAVALIEAGLILPVLDGLDEIPEPVRGRAVSRINDALRPGEQVVVTCRSQQYRDAVRPLDGVEVTLRGAAAIELRPLDADAVRSYLRDDAGGPVARSRWDPVLGVLGTGSPAGQALSTPLMVGLARAIYNPRPGELAGAMPDPAELLGLADHAAVQAHLFDQFIPAAYRIPAGSRCTARQAETWLVFLARHLEHTIGTPDLAWWQLRNAAPGRVLGLVFGIAAGIAAGLTAGLTAGIAGGLGAGLTAGIEGGLAAGLMAGIAVGLIAGITARPTLPARGIRIHKPGLVAAPMVGLVFGPVVGSVVGIRFGIAVGIATALETGLLFGFKSVSPDPAETTNPQTTLARDRQLALILALVFGLGVGVATGTALPTRVGLVSGLVFGLVAGLVAAQRETQWVAYMLARTWLAMRGRLPWPLMSFLADAHQRGVLRQAGATYQFRHLELQTRLATRP